jgi:hypothetical protein
MNLIITFFIALKIMLCLETNKADATAGNTCLLSGQTPLCCCSRRLLAAAWTTVWQKTEKSAVKIQFTGAPEHQTLASSDFQRR